MSSSEERQAGTSGSTTGYEQEQAQMPAQGQGRDYAPAGRDTQVRGRHQAQGTYQEQGAYQERGGYRAEAPEQNRGAVIGFTALAGTLMLLSGLWMAVVAIVALSHGHVFTTAPAYAFRYNIRGWGWLELSLGVVIFAAGMCVFLGMAWARYVGAFLAVLSAIANFVFIPYQPLWSIVMIALDAFIIWALLTPRRYANEF